MIIVFIGPNDGGQGSNVAGIITGVSILTILMALIVMVLQRKKKERGIQWFPENFTLTGSAIGLNRKRAGDHKQELSGFGSKSYLDMERWSEDDPLESASKRRRQDYW